MHPLFPFIFVIVIIVSGYKEVDFKNTPTIHVISNSTIETQEQDENLNWLIQQLTNSNKLHELEKITNNFVKEVNAGTTSDDKNNLNKETSKETSKMNKKMLKKQSKGTTKHQSVSQMKDTPIKTRNSALELKQLMRVVKKELKQRRREIKQMKRQKQKQLVKGTLSKKDFVPNLSSIDERHIRKIVHDQAKKSFLRLALKMKSGNLKIK